MTKARRRQAQPRSALTPGAPQPRAISDRGQPPRLKTGVRPGSEPRSRWPRWGVELAAFAAVVAVGLLAWWLLSFRNGGDDGTGAGGARPIATLESADVHSLLIDPNDADHVLFGSHAGVQESRDGGFTWQLGSLRNADAMGMGGGGEAPATFYAVGHNVFQISRDGGQTWQSAQHNLPGVDLHAFAQDSNDPLRLYTLVAGMGLFTSGDGGTTWTPLPAAPPGGMPGALAAGPSVLYATTASGVAVTRDGGATWESLTAPPGGGVMALAVAAADPQTIYAATSSGLAKSTDAGASWLSIGPARIPALALAVAPSDPNRVLFVAEGGGVYRSDDGGASWVTLR